MTWFKVDDKLCGHPKARAAGLPAMGLWAVAGSWCSQQLTDGHVPDWYVTTWPSGKQLAERLVQAGWWHKVGHSCPDCPTISEGYVYHDFHQANPTREEELDRKAKRAAAGRKGGKASGASRARGSSSDATSDEANAQASVVANHEANASASVEPPSRPVPTTSGSLRSPAPPLELVPPPDETLNAGAIVAAYVDGAVKAGRGRPTERMRGKVAKSAKRLLDQEHYPAERLIAAATQMGSRGWDDLDRELQRLDPPGSALAVNGHRAYQNPIDPAAFREGL